MKRILGLVATVALTACGNSNDLLDTGKAEDAKNALLGGTRGGNGCGSQGQGVYEGARHSQPQGCAGATR